MIPYGMVYDTVWYGVCHGVSGVLSFHWSYPFEHIIRFLWL